MSEFQVGYRKYIDSGVIWLPIYYQDNVSRDPKKPRTLL